MLPVVSVVVANHNGAAYIRQALRSATRQTLADLEILVVDDASSDDSRRIVQDLARSDPRIRLIALADKAGPAAARNAGLAAARGRWVAILDSDDMMHPERLATLVAVAEREKADLIADDLLVFQNGTAPRPFLSRRQRGTAWITPAEFVRANAIFAGIPALGYLKPLINRAFIETYGIRYDASLRIGEDYDLVLRLLLYGARYRLVDQLGYFYRKHAHSTSHRISREELMRLLEADLKLDAAFGSRAAAVADERRRRCKSIERAVAFTELVSALKARAWRSAAGLALRRPEVVPLLWMPVAARLARTVKPAAPRPRRDAGEKRACVISRQRLIGSRAGSSAYLLSLCRELHEAGYRLSLISPSPAMFGRWPFLSLSSEMELFDEIHMRGSFRLGRRLFVATNPRVLISAVLTIAERFLLRIGVVHRARVKPAPYAIAVPWQRADHLYVARHAPPHSSVVVADYAFVAPAIPFALCPEALSVIVMHDLFSARPSQFEALKKRDSLVAIEEGEELALLSQSDAVLAIQGKEAAFVAERLPRQRVILAPMGIDALETPQPGDDETLLFVGSNTAPNVIGLEWFLDSVWADVRQRVPRARLVVAGTVGQALQTVPDGVTLLGVVPKLEPVYADPGVVISPLFAGSGLKIKLIEALGRGKAIVATSHTVEGVADVVRDAVVLADEPRAFAEAVCELLEDAARRETLCCKALEVARQSFSTKASYAQFMNLVRQHEQTFSKSGLRDDEGLKVAVEARVGGG